jgi:hypothetical protein
MFGPAKRDVRPVLFPEQASASQYVGASILLWRVMGIEMVGMKRNSSSRLVLVLVLEMVG